MKITAQEEYGLRILLRIASADQSNGISISEITESEGMTLHNVAKLCRILRLAGFIRSSRGKNGGYLLNQSPEKIYLNKVLEVLGGKLFSPEFCSSHSCIEKLYDQNRCCSVKYLWKIIQNSIDEILKDITILNLLSPQQVAKKSNFNNNSKRNNIMLSS